mgnify:CR=1 FL=1
MNGDKSCMFVLTKIYKHFSVKLGQLGNALALNQTRFARAKYQGLNYFVSNYTYSFITGGALENVQYSAPTRIVIL